jgi:hypothetical protein
MGVEAAVHIETKLGDIEDAETKEVKLSPPIHLPFQAFQSVDLALRLTLTPRQRTRGRNCLVILLHALGEPFEFRDLTAFRCFDPLLQVLRSAFSQNTQEVLTQLIGRRQLQTPLTHLLELPLLIRSELLLRKHKEPGGFLRRKPIGARETERQTALLPESA